MEVTVNGLRKGAWTAEEDRLLKQCVEKYGEGKWHKVPSRTGLKRCRKSCRLRWLNYLKPNIKRGKLSSDEIDLLLRLHKLLGNRWSLIAGRLPGRTANDVKNFWNTHLSKKHEPSCNTKIEKKIITSSSTTSVQKIDVIKPLPRSFFSNNGVPKVDVIPPCPRLINNNNVCEISSTCDKDEENYESVCNLTGEDNMWLKSLLDESQVEDVSGPSGPKATETQNEATLAFDVDQLWKLFDGDTAELV